MKTEQMRVKQFGLLGSLLVAAILAAAPTVQAGDAWYTNWAAGATGDYWTNAVNWTNAAGGHVYPDNGHAYLTRTNASYTVIYDTAAPAISNLFVQNKTGNQTTLNISAPLSHVGGYISLSNATVNLTNNAVWTYPGTNSTADRLMEIVGGATLNICGGSVQFINVQRATTSQRSYVYVGYSTSGAGTLNVNSGSFNFWTPNNANNSSMTFTVGLYAGSTGSVWVAPGATMLLSDANGYSPSVGVQGGRGSMVVGGTLVLTNTPDVNFPYVGSGNGGYGEFVFTNSALYYDYTGGPRWYVGSGGSCYGVLRFCGTNTFPVNSYGIAILMVGENGRNPVAGCSTGVMEVLSGTVRDWGNMYIGLANGSTNYAAVGTLNIYGGTVANNTAYGTWIGFGQNGGNGAGTINMTGGVLTVSAGGNYQPVQYPAGVSPWGYPICGLDFGVILLSNLTDDPSPYTRASGTLNLSGGTITNNYDMVLGCNGGTGIVTQTGGIVQHLPVDTNRLTYIGYGFGTNSYSGAGDGSYAISGGSFTSPNRVFVGGVSTGIQWYAKAGAKGLLKVTGGSFTTKSTLYVGENGSGTVTMGSNGTLTVGNLYATNAASKLRFELGSAGIGTFTVTNELRVGAASLLEVDMAKFRQPGMTKLLNCKTRTGSFAAANISVTGGPGTVVQSKDEDIYLNINRGSVVTVR